MKFLRWVVWILIAIAIILILMAGISLVFNLDLLGTGHVVNFFHSANSLLLLAIAIYVVTDKLSGCWGKTKEVK